MAKGKSTKGKTSEVTECIACVAQGKEEPKEATSRGLCPNHLAQASKLVNGVKDKKTGEYIKKPRVTWEQLVQAGKALEARRQSASDWFLEGIE